jgi:hypothetical protein
MESKKTTALNEAIKTSKLKLNSILEDSGIKYRRLWDLRQGTTEPTLAEANSLSQILEKSTNELFPIIK